nr:MAG TPA: hypothetical protein [Caudoviricetes sp.]
MTREEIAKSLKPIAWDIWEGNKYRFAQPTEVHEAMIMTRDDGCLIVKINRHGRITPEVYKAVNTMQEAEDIVREWLIDHICSYFQMND